MELFNLQTERNYARGMWRGGDVGLSMRTGGLGLLSRSVRSGEAVGLWLKNTTKNTLKMKSLLFWQRCWICVDIWFSFGCRKSVVERVRARAHAANVHGFLGFSLEGFHHIKLAAAISASSVGNTYLFLWRWEQRTSHGSSQPVQGRVCMDTRHTHM